MIEEHKAPLNFSPRDPYEGQSEEFRYWMGQADYYRRMSQVCQGVAEREGGKRHDN